MTGSFAVLCTAECTSESVFKIGQRFEEVMTENWWLIGLLLIVSIVVQRGYKFCRVNAQDITHNRPTPCPKNKCHYIFDDNFNTNCSIAIFLVHLLLSL